MLRPGAKESDIAASSKEAMATYPQLKGKLLYMQPGRSRKKPRSHCARMLSISIGEA